MQMPSARTNAQIFGMRFLAQISGFVCRQPTVLSDVSPGLSGSWNALSLRIRSRLV